VLLCVSFFSFLSRPLEAGGGVSREGGKRAFSPTLPAGPVLCVPSDVMLYPHANGAGWAGRKDPPSRGKATEGGWGKR